MLAASERGSLVLSSPPWPAFPARPAAFPSVRFPRRARNARLVAGAGPTAANYVFAFVFPLSLLVVTIAVSARIGNQLDQKYLEELAINQAIEEADLDEDPEDLMEETPVATRTRNRPKRQGIGVC
ncbi:hypothetical protein MLD38_002764 [Melastoma candidum]|uniref:Uncharacterized protein n=1 Tax=Melastoma candidum TaxID=119954 RepID=A0ACB9S059_9MYRT|nr:hypothetical protein MLD38_002764 [Melastoma candidum]